MATSFETIYNQFLSKIADADLLLFTVDQRSTMLRQLLFSAQTACCRIAPIDLGDTDEENEQFSQTLCNEIVEILALGMVWAWISPQVNNSDKMHNFLNTKDFNVSSPANMLKELRELRDSAYADFQRAVVAYSYVSGDISDWRP